VSTVRVCPGIPGGGEDARAAGVTTPARIYDLRSTFISNALPSGLTVFETARIAGTLLTRKCDREPRGVTGEC